MQSTNVPGDFYDKIRPELYRRIGRELGLAHRVLDLGCGHCDLVTYLREAYLQRVIGVDTSDSSLPRMRTHSILDDKYRQALVT